MGLNLNLNINGAKRGLATPPVPTDVVITVVSDTEFSIAYVSAFPVEFWYSTTEGGVYTKHGDSASTPYPMTGLTQGTLYYVKPRSVNGSKFSDFGSVVSATTYPSIINTNTIAWFDYADTNKVTKDENNLVGKWEDKLGGLIYLAQSDNAKKPLYQSSGILFDGVDDFLEAATFNFSQPEYIYMVVKNKTYKTNARLFDGNANNSGACYNRLVDTDGLVIYAGAALEVVYLTYESFGIIRIAFNGANSKIQIDDHNVVGGIKIGNAGTNNMSGLKLGTNGFKNVFSNIEIKEIILRDSIDNEIDIYDYFVKKYGESYLLIGDSITSPCSKNIWWNDYKYRFTGSKIPFFRNEAISGATVIDDSIHSSMLEQIDASQSAYINNVFILIGTNDLDDENIGITYKSNLEQLKIYHPGAKIYCLSILEKADGYNVARDANNPRLKAAAESVSGVMWIDTDGWIDVSTDLLDNTHPNALGHYKIATEMLNILDV